MTTFATTRDVWTQQNINAALAELDEKLQKVRGLPGAYDVLEQIARRIEDLEATR